MINVDKNKKIDLIELFEQIEGTDDVNIFYRDKEKLENKIKGINRSIRKLGIKQFLVTKDLAIYRTK